MDPQTKSAIKSLVLDLRHTLEDELTIVLKRYGLFTDRAWSLEEPPARLTDETDRLSLLEYDGGPARWAVHPIVRPLLEERRDEFSNLA